MQESHYDRMFAYQTMQQLVNGNYTTHQDRFAHNCAYHVVDYNWNLEPVDIQNYVNDTFSNWYTHNYHL